MVYSFITLKMYSIVYSVLGIGAYCLYAQLILQTLSQFNIIVYMMKDNIQNTVNGYTNT